MYLFRQKLKGKPIDHPLGKTDLELDDKRIHELLNQLKEGKKYPIDEIVQRHIKLAICISSQYALFAPQKAHDFVSEALLSILICCNTIEKMKDDNLTGYIISRIHSKLSKALQEDNLIRIPRTSSYRRRKEGKEIILPVRNIEYTNHNIKLLQIEDLIKKSIKTKQEKEVITLRRCSYTDHEIASILDLSPSRIAQIRTEVYERFKKLERD
jgi:DNA-directed RNA polymerase specialized sigma subunit